MSMRAAALLILVKEYAPGGNRSAAKSDGSCVIDFAELAVVAAFLYIKALGFLAVLIAYGELFACALCASTIAFASS